MMVDIRDYKGTIREAVRRERHCDQNWAWKVRAINKSAAKIGWGYLEWLGEKGADFVVEVDEGKDIGTVVIGRVPDGHQVIRFIGDSRWDDFKTVDEGIASVIHGMAQYAHLTY